jgi:hypothetical protein
MADNLGTAAYKLVLDAREFNSSAVTSGKQMRDVQQVMRQTTTPAEKMAASYDSVTAAYQKGEIPLKNYQRYLDQLNTSAAKNADAVRNMAAQYGAKIPVVGKYVSMLGKVPPQAIAATAAIAGLGAAVAATAWAVKTYVGTMTAEFDRLVKFGDVAAKLGADPNDITGLRIAGRETSVAENTMDMAMQRMTRRSAEAARGTGEAVKALKELGIEARSFAVMPLDRKMIELAKAFEQVDGQGNKVRLAFKLFDSEGVSLVNTLALGEERLREIFATVDSRGLGTTQEDIDRMREYQIAIDGIRDRWTGLWQQVAINAAPGMTAAVEQMNDALKDPEVQKAIERTITLLSMIGQFTPIIAQDVAKIPAALERTFEIMTPDWLQGIMALVPDGMLPSIMGTAEEIEQLKKFEEQIQGMFDPLRQAGEARNALSILDAEEEVKKIEELERAEQQRTKALEAAAAAYQDQIDTFGMAAREAEIYRLQQQAVTDTERGQIETLRQLDAELKKREDRERQLTEQRKAEVERQRQADKALADAQNQADKALADAQKQRERIFEQAARAMDRFATPEEKYAQTVKELISWLQLGAISLRDFARAKEAAAAELGKSVTLGKVVTAEEGERFGSAESIRNFYASRMGGRDVSATAAGIDQQIVQQQRQQQADAEVARQQAEIQRGIAQAEQVIPSGPTREQQESELLAEQERTREELTSALDSLNATMGEVAVNTRNMAQDPGRVHVVGSL